MKAALARVSARSNQNEPVSVVAKNFIRADKREETADMPSQPR